MNEEIQIILETTEKVLHKNITHQLRQNIDQNNIFKSNPLLFEVNQIIDFFDTISITPFKFDSKPTGS